MVASGNLSQLWIKARGGHSRLAEADGWIAWTATGRQRKGRKDTARTLEAKEPMFDVLRDLLGPKSSVQMVTHLPAGAYVFGGPT